MNINVTIPVLVGGYTGQRDQWEALSRDYKVSFDEASREVTLETKDAIGRKIVFNYDELDEALAFVREHR